MSFADWLGATEGHRVDLDNDSSADCVDVPESWSHYIYPGVGINTLLGYGNAKDLYANSNPQYFRKIPAGGFIPGQGDIVVYGATSSNPYGHIAVVIQADDKGINMLEQNSFTQEPATRATRSYNNVIGFLRPKVLEEQNMPTLATPELVDSLAHAYLNDSLANNAGLQYYVNQPVDSVIAVFNSSQERDSFLKSLQVKDVKIADLQAQLATGTTKQSVLDYIDKHTS